MTEDGEPKVLIIIALKCLRTNELVYTETIQVATGKAIKIY